MVVISWESKQIMLSITRPHNVFIISSDKHAIKRQSNKINIHQYKDTTAKIFILQRRHTTINAYHNKLRCQKIPQMLPKTKRNCGQH